MQTAQLQEEVLRAITSNKPSSVGLERIHRTLSTLVTDEELMGCLAELVAIGKLETAFNKHIVWKLRISDVKRPEPRM